MSHIVNFKQKLIAKAFRDKSEELIDILEWMPRSLLLEERWAKISGYEGMYKVSNMGRVMSMVKLDEYIIKPSLNEEGYIKATLKGKSFGVHRLVAFAFVPNPDPIKYNVVNHKDEIPPSNFAVNLEWCNHSYNQSYSFKKNGEKSHLAKINEETAFKIKELLRTLSPRQVASHLNISYDIVSGIATGRSWCHLSNPRYSKTAA